MDYGKRVNLIIWYRNYKNYDKALMWPMLELTT
jgi:hypothetical protein